MKKLKIDCITSLSHLEQVEKHLSANDLENLELDIDFLIREIQALRGNYITYGEKLLVRDMLRKGFLLAHIECNNDKFDLEYKKTL